MARAKVFSRVTSRQRAVHARLKMIKGLEERTTGLEVLRTCIQKRSITDAVLEELTQRLEENDRFNAMLQKVHKNWNDASNTSLVKMKSRSTRLYYKIHAMVGIFFKIVFCKSDHLIMMFEMLDFTLLDSATPVLEAK